MLNKYNHTHNKINVKVGNLLTAHLINQHFLGTRNYSRLNFFFLSFLMETSSFSLLEGVLFIFVLTDLCPAPSWPVKRAPTVLKMLN